MICFASLPCLRDWATETHAVHTQETHDKSKRDETVQFMWCVDVYYTHDVERARSLRSQRSQSVSVTYLLARRTGPHAHPRCARGWGSGADTRIEVLTVFASHARPSASAAELAAIQAPNCILASFVAPGGVRTCPGWPPDPGPTVGPGFDLSSLLLSSLPLKTLRRGGADEQ